MKKRKLFIILIILLGGLILSVYNSLASIFNEEEVGVHVDQANQLEEKIEILSRKNYVLNHEVKSYLSQVRSKELASKVIQIDNGKNVDALKRDSEEDKIVNSALNVTLDSQESLWQIPKTNLADGRPVIGVLVFSCDRVTVKRSIDRLIKFRPSKEQFPVIVSQDCGHKPTREAIQSYGDEVFLIKQPDLSDIPVPPKEKKFKGYFKIARHYGWALNHTFNALGFKTIIIVEDDLDVSEDFFEYFLGTFWLLRADPTLWCVSAWNDNGHASLIDESQPQLLYRTDFFPGLGWMLTDALWAELSVKWPKSYWDDWIRKPEQRKGRACIRPEVSRTKTFGKIGVSNGLFFEKHLKYIKLNEDFVSFTQMNLSHLLKVNYDPIFLKEVYDSYPVTLADLRSKDLSMSPIRLVYHTKEEYKKFTKQLGLMDDFRSGVGRTAYKGVVSFAKDDRRIYLAPQLPWNGYNVSWS